jgi:hypothetical protein
MNEDGFTNEQAIKLRMKGKKEKKELLEELNGLGLNIWEVKIVNHFGKFNTLWKNDGSISQ